MGLGKGLLEQLIGLGKELWCGVGMQLAMEGGCLQGDRLQGGGLVWPDTVV